METFKVVLTFESVDEILWCDHSNETLSAVLSHGTIYIWVFYKMKFGICLEFDFMALLGVKGLSATGDYFLTECWRGGTLTISLPVVASVKTQEKSYEQTIM